jgi:PiT family inorganic phosphate transporter
VNKRGIKLDLPIAGIIIIGVALFFDFINGFHDSSNVVATMISSRAMSARNALTLSAAAHFCGPFLFGVAVATTVGQEVVDPKSITTIVIFAALLAAIIWNLATWYFGIPSSSSHALVGGLIGAVSIDSGFVTIQMRGLLKVTAALFLSPILGLIAGYLLMRLVLFLARGASPRINRIFKRAQIMTSLALALSHGTNDAQKTMGIIAMALVTLGYLPEFSVPWWVVALCAGAMSLGTAFGGWRVIRTLGTKFYKIRPVHGFAAQVASASIILGAAFLGGPVSTTHVVSSAILGVGSAERVSRVRWNVVGNIITTWVLTIPTSALLAALLHLVIHFLLQS